MRSNDFGDPLAQLEAAVEALAADDMKSMFGPQVLERTARLLRAQHLIAAQVTRSVREGELAQASQHDGAKTMQSWLRGHPRLSPSAAAQLVRNGRALEQLPAVEAAFAAGVVTADQVAVIAPVASVRAQAEAVGQGVDLAAVDQTLARIAATRPYRELSQVVHHYLARLDPDGTEPDPTEGRSLSIARNADGSRSFRGQLDAVGGEKLELWLESYVRADRPAGDTRTRAQQFGDALVQGVDVALAAGQAPILRTVKPHVAVMIKLDDLMDPATGPGAATTGLGTMLSAARARWLACDSTVSRVIMGPDGRILDHGRDQRIVPASLRRSVEVQDRHCIFAGCEAPAPWCDVHHVLEWHRDDGPTSLENSALLCERHHTQVHHGFSVVRGPDGRWCTYRPDGTEILIGQPLLI
ncbi:HNH endonuclease signature motif containing protein [Blastococcus deserti]|uniref:DUF222 domain-containing protein n=1 Tax=Blastococcus deserti TaxID=2259033 RepID=A0ABW4XGE6_9ACTN